MSWTEENIARGVDELAKRAQEIVEELAPRTASSEAKNLSAQLLLQRAAQQIRKG